MSVGLDPFSDAHAAADAASHVALDVLRHLEAAAPRGATLRTIEPVSSLFPEHPLDTAVRDLANATSAAGRAAEAASASGSELNARLCADAARLATETLTLADSVASSAALRDDTVQREHVAHAAASTAHAAAALLASLPRGTRHDDHVAFPASWQRLIAMLSDAIRTAAPADGQRSLLEAASAARDGAEAARRAYEVHAATTAASATACRFVRIASLSAVYAGCAALVPLRAGVDATV